ncbi:hypothetical protein QP478_01155 [Lactobacillus paragasseri]|jgi:hypothetical protein|uniref:Uncharacterized protein n=1 Tax=Lactobacillus paragasseri TaxID=2107999 RepID=A0ABD4ZIB9_9LACO|nr:hypothetical protein [Lactobacillus paragasseri]MDK7297815.1 hypothetical protein [Lactobacillus paragasseri]
MDKYKFLKQIYDKEKVGNASITIIAAVAESYIKNKNRPLGRNDEYYEIRS